MKKIIIMTAAMLWLFSPKPATYAVESEDIRIHGFISQGYLKSDKNDYLANTSDGIFEFNEMGINFSTDLSDNLRIGIELLSRDLGDLGNDEITIPWAYADYSWKESLGLRVGLMKNCLGFYADIWDVDALRTPIMIPNAIYSETGRDAQSTIKGFGLYGNINMNAAGILQYQTLYGTFQTGPGIMKFVADKMGTEDAIYLRLPNSFIGKLEWKTPLDGFRLAYSYMQTEMNFKGTVPASMFMPEMYMIVESSPIEYQVLSLEYLIGNFLIGGEFGQQTVKNTITFQDTTYNQTLMSFPMELGTGDMYYINSSYQFTEWFQLGAYYSAYEEHKDWEANSMGRPDNNNYLHDLCVTFRFDIGMNWIVKLEEHLMDGAVYTMVSPEEGETVADPDWNLFAVKVSYTF